MRQLVLVLSISFIVCLVFQNTVNPPATEGGLPQQPATSATPSPAPVTINESTGTIRGRVIYTGPPAENKVRMIAPNKCVNAHPKQIPQEGWYTAQSMDGIGVRYAVVFLRPVGQSWRNIDPQVVALRGGTKAKTGPDILDVSIPKGQFEPRVTVLLPGQKVRGKNDGNPQCQNDFMLQGGLGRYGGGVPYGKSLTLELPADDHKPYLMFCNCHLFRSGYVWSFSHPFAVVTDENGEFTIHQVPVLSSGKMELVVWHEMLKTDKNMKVIGEVKIGCKEEMKLTIKLP